MIYSGWFSNPSELSEIYGEKEICKLSAITEHTEHTNTANTYGLMDTILFF